MRFQHPPPASSPWQSMMIHVRLLVGTPEIPALFEIGRTVQEWHLIVFGRKKKTKQN